MRVWRLAVIPVVALALVACSEIEPSEPTPRAPETGGEEAGTPGAQDATREALSFEDLTVDDLSAMLLPPESWNGRVRQPLRFTPSAGFLPPGPVEAEEQAALDGMGFRMGYRLDYYTQSLTSDVFAISSDVTLFTSADGVEEYLAYSNDRLAEDASEQVKNFQFREYEIPRVGDRAFAETWSYEMGDRKTVSVNHFAVVGPMLLMVDISASDHVDVERELNEALAELVERVEAYMAGELDAEPLRVPDDSVGQARTPRGL